MKTPRLAPYAKVWLESDPRNIHYDAIIENVEMSPDERERLMDSILRRANDETIIGRDERHMLALRFGGVYPLSIDLLHLNQDSVTKLEFALSIFMRQPYKDALTLNLDFQSPFGKAEVTLHRRGERWPNEVWLLCDPNTADTRFNRGLINLCEEDVRALHQCVMDLLSINPLGGRDISYIHDLHVFRSEKFGVELGREETPGSRTLLISMSEARRIFGREVDCDRWDTIKLPIESHWLELGGYIPPRRRPDTTGRFPRNE